MSTDTARKAIFVTGAASGIGRATARLFAAEEWFIGCFDRNGGALEVLKEVGEANGRLPTVGRHGPRQLQAGPRCVQRGKRGPDGRAA